VTNYKQKNYANETYVPADVSFTSYTTTFLSDKRLSLKYFVVLDEIAIDQSQLHYNDDWLQFALLDYAKNASFLQTRMNKEAYPDKFLFKGRQGDVLRAFMFQVGGTKTFIHRTVPGLLVQLSSAGGLFNCFKIILGFFNFIFVLPIDTVEFFFAM
jgi:hypothetical protein